MSYVRHLNPSHCFAAAVTQSGKTTCLVVPTILDSPTVLDRRTGALVATESLIIHDPKDEGDPIPGGELYTLTAGWRAQVSKVIRFQPLSETSHRYDPLRAVRLYKPQETRDLQLVSDMLTDPDGNGMEGLSDAGQHFTPMASDVHLGVLTHGLYTRTATTLGDFYRVWSGSVGIDEVAKVMATTRHVDGHCHPSVVQAVRTIQETADREKTALVNTARRALRLWSDPLVRHATSGSDFTLHDLREGLRPLTLYLSFPFEDAERMRPLSRLLLRQCLQYAASRGQGWAFPLKAILDEFQSLGRLPLLRHMLNYSLGRGVTLLLITPSLREITRVWGRDHPFLEGCGTKMVFGMRSGKVADEFLDSVPTHEVTKQRTSWTPDGWWWKKTLSEEVREESLVSRSDVLQLDDKKVLALLGNLVVLLDKAYYKDNPVWLRRSLLPVPEAA
jgi:type IV secretion system protein VirD4